MEIFWEYLSAAFANGWYIGLGVIEVIGIGFDLSGSDRAWRHRLGKALWISGLVVGLFLGPFQAYKAMRGQRDEAIHAGMATSADYRPLSQATREDIKQRLISFREQFRDPLIAHIDCRMENTPRSNFCGDLVDLFQEAGFDASRSEIMGGGTDFPMTVTVPVSSKNPSVAQFASILNRYVRSSFLLSLDREEEATRLNPTDEIKRFTISIDGEPRFHRDGTITFNRDD